jgi:hypothetical protein
MEIQDIVEFDNKHKISQHDSEIKKQNSQELQMTSSTTSSLASPGDSGVQLLDSESEVTSVMSVSGIGCDIDNIPSLEHDLVEKKDMVKEKDILQRTEELNWKNIQKNEAIDHNKDNKQTGQEQLIKSDTTNQNLNQLNFSQISKSVPNYFDKFELASESTFIKCSLEKSKKEVLNKSLSDEVFEMEHPIKDLQEKPPESDLMNVSLNSYELLDYTLQNKLVTNVENVDQMHVSMSEEVNENLKINLHNSESAVLPIVEDVPVVEKPVEEQIVFRRQRKKKSKSDTPKKRVSFHEDILNSTKIDDIHINHGFITHEPDVSLSFFQRGFVRKPDVIKGRYSWAAEGDAPYYEKAPTEREIKSDLYIQHNTRFSSTSSSSTGSMSSSIDEDSEENCVKKEPTLKQPKSSCLKKTNHSKKYIDTNIVQEETNRKRRSDSNLLDTNIFGSLKNILNFSTSVPLAERGVPEGQEDFAIYSSSHESNRRKSCTNLTFKGFEPLEVLPLPVKKTDKPNVSSNKTNLKLTASEGFYPNYPSNQNLPANVIVCDSNVYEHKGISYSYEYDKFQKSFEQQNKPKSSTVYQMILKEFNFFRKKAKEPEKELPDDFEIVSSANPPVREKSDSIEEVQEAEYKSPKNSVSKYASSTKMDWSDNETISDMSSENVGGRHLHSPKRKVSRTNHYSLSPFKMAPSESSRSDQEGSLVTSKSLQNLKPSTSKTSLINRFLRNVTLKKMLDVKAQNKQKNRKKYLGLYVKDFKFEYKGKDEVDEALEREILRGKEICQKNSDDIVDKKFVIQLKKEIFRSRLERLLRVIAHVLVLHFLYGVLLSGVPGEKCLFDERRQQTLAVDTDRLHFVHYGSQTGQFSVQSFCFTLY